MNERFDGVCYYRIKDEIVSLARTAINARAYAAQLLIQQPEAAAPLFREVNKAFQYQPLFVPARDGKGYRVEKTLAKTAFDALWETYEEFDPKDTPSRNTIRDLLFKQETNLEECFSLIDPSGAGMETMLAGTPLLGRGTIHRGPFARTPYGDVLKEYLHARGRTLELMEDYLDFLVGKAEAQAFPEGTGDERARRRLILKESAKKKIEHAFDLYEPGRESYRSFLERIMARRLESNANLWAAVDENGEEPHSHWKTRDGLRHPGRRDPPKPREPVPLPFPEKYLNEQYLPLIFKTAERLKSEVQRTMFKERHGKAYASLENIGKKHGISRQRVHGALHRAYGHILDALEEE